MDRGRSVLQPACTAWLKICGAQLNIMCELNTHLSSDQAAVSLCQPEHLV